MRILAPRPRPLTPETFGEDRHAARYLGVREDHRAGFDGLVRILNEPANEQRLQDASERDEAALRGIEKVLYRDPAVVAAITDAATGHRFRQAVGVAIRLKMESLGWTTSGRKGPALGPHFTRAEKYVRVAAPSPTEQALAALDRVAAIGDEGERQHTGEQLMAALAATRSEQGRPF